MQCKCGAETVVRQHKVQSLAVALRWYEVAHEDELPINVNRDECMSCGRQHMRPYTQWSKS